MYPTLCARALDVAFSLNLRCLFPGHKSTTKYTFSALMLSSKCIRTSPTRSCVTVARLSLLDVARSKARPALFLVQSLDCLHDNLDSISKRLHSEAFGDSLIPNNPIIIKNADPVSGVVSLEPCATSRSSHANSMGYHDCPASDMAYIRPEAWHAQLSSPSLSRISV